MAKGNQGQNSSLTRESELAKKIASARASLADQQEFSKHLFSRLDSAITKIESLGNKPSKTWRERLLEWREAIWHVSTWTKLFAALSIVVGFAASIYSLGPRVTISLGERLLPMNALTAQVIIANDGAFPIYNVQMDCTSASVKYVGGGSLTIQTGGFLHHEGNDAPVIGPGQKYTTASFCITPMGIPTDFDVILRVAFKPFLLPRQYRDFRIISLKSPDGNIITAQRPVP